MSKKRLGRMILVCTMAICMIVVITILPSCGSPPSPTYGLEFDGVDDYISLGNATVLGFTSQNFTVEAWINPANVTSGMIIFQRCSWKNDGYRFRTEASGIVSFATYQSGVSQISRTSNDTLAAGKWYYVAVVRQGASVKIFVNAVSKTATAGSHIDPAYVATREAQIGSSVSETFEGSISEVRVWNSARSESEIKADMSNEPTGTEEGLIGYWKLNEGSGIIAHDSTANNNSGTLYGNPVWFGGGG
jgi:hypothetical protein